ncbi:hypothetical protein [Plastoroseomonas arctica]|uniref:Uncharacterized protein n=1 Tax=Plastoroseomonas arctica TaxID=1509237 RepID=A0AAF1JY02_9PROT|nr:hypothetical protein [Plastoroseomonas arctica]MBR0653934.1 hypothetical protein [Plastoroseomonas arctica]
MRIIAPVLAVLLPWTVQAQALRQQVVPSGDVVAIAPRGVRAPSQPAVEVAIADPAATGARIGAAPPGWVPPPRPLSFGRSFSGFSGEADGLGGAALQAAPTLLGLAAVAALTTLFGGRPSGNSGTGSGGSGTTTATTSGIAAPTSTR